MINDSNIDKIMKTAWKSSYECLRELAHEVNITFKSVHNILIVILDMKHITAQLFSKELNFAQKEHQKEVAEDMITRAPTNLTFIICIITGEK